MHLCPLFFSCKELQPLHLFRKHFQCTILHVIFLKHILLSSTHKHVFCKLPICLYLPLCIYRKCFYRPCIKVQVRVGLLMLCFGANLELESICHTMSLRNRKVSTTPLTQDPGFDGNLRLEKCLNRVEDARSQTAAGRLRKADRRTWKESQFPAGLGNHTVIYKLGLSLHLTWPFSFYYRSTRLVSEEKSTTALQNLLQLD